MRHDTSKARENSFTTRLLAFTGGLRVSLKIHEG